MESAYSVKRIEYFDFLRGIAIVMVVAIHTFGEVYTYSNISFLAVLLRQILSCAVPIFCVSSAFFLTKKEVQGGGLKKRILKVYIPLLVFSFLYLINDLMHNRGFIKSILKFLVGGYSVYYFVALIIQFYVLFPLFRKYRIVRNPFITGLVSLLWVSLYTYVIRPIHPLPLLLYGGPVWCFIVYFSLGSTFQLDNLKERVNLQVCCIIACVMLIISCLESYFIMGMTNSLTGVGLKPSAVLFSIFVCAILYSDTCSASFSESALTKHLSKLGRYSYGIYLLHMYCLWLVSKFIIKTGFTISDYGLFYWLVYTLIVLYLSYLLLWIAKRIQPKVSRVCLGV